ncbi:uncharacterized protein V6R79_007660 [Siganus canaliculatus]
MLVYLLVLGLGDGVAQMPLDLAEDSEPVDRPLVLHLETWLCHPHIVLRLHQLTVLGAVSLESILPASILLITVPALSAPASVLLATVPASVLLTTLLASVTLLTSVLLATLSPVALCVSLFKEATPGASSP